MKKIEKFAAFAAAVMIATLAGCAEKSEPALRDNSTIYPSNPSEPEQQSTQSAPTSEPQSVPTEGFPEEPSDASLKYYEDAVNIVDKYLSSVMGNGDEVKQLGLTQLDLDAPENRRKMEEYLLDCAKKGESYLDELEALTPTEEMSAFHNGLVELMNTLREYSDIAKTLETLDINSDEAEQKFMNKVDELFVQFNKKYTEFYIKYPGFGNTLAEGEWQKNGSSTSQYITVDLTGEANRAAQTVLTAVTDWAEYSMFNDKSAISNAVIEIYKTENECAISGAAIDEMELEALKQEIDFLSNEFWAQVYLDADGIPQYVLLSLNGKLDESELNGGSGLESNLREWQSTGVTSSGHIVGMVGVPPTSGAQ